MRVRLVRNELIVDQGGPDALGAVPPAQHLQKLVLEVLGILPTATGSDGREVRVGGYIREGMQQRRICSVGAGDVCTGSRRTVHGLFGVIHTPTSVCSTTTRRRLPSACEWAELLRFPCKVTRLLSGRHDGSTANDGEAFCSRSNPTPISSRASSLKRVWKSLARKVQFHDNLYVSNDVDM